jgi:hypothetical protein
MRNYFIMMGICGFTEATQLNEELVESAPINES